LIRIVKKPDVRRQEIISAARALFLQKDYAHTTMQDVMSTLGIAKGTIYHYFASKEELLDAVVQDLVEEYIVAVQETLAISKGSAVDRMRALITAGQIADTQKETLEQLHRPGNIAMHSRLLAITISKLAYLYAEVIEQGCAEGIFQVEHPLESAELLIAGIQFLTDEGCYPWSKTDLLRRIKAIPALFDAQLNAPKGTFNFLDKQIAETT
jgi:AcrR family transcriptional regulator